MCTGAFIIYIEGTQVNITTYNISVLPRTFTRIASIATFFHLLFIFYNPSVTFDAEQINGSDF